MGVKRNNAFLAWLLCFILLIGLFIGFVPIVYAEEPAQDLPTIHEPDGFKLNSEYEAATSNVKVPVFSSIDAEAPKQQKIPFTIIVKNFEEPVVVAAGQKVKAGTIEINYGDLLAATPTTTVKWLRTYYDLTIDGAGEKYTSGNITLTSGKATNTTMITGPMQYDESGQATNKLLITYDIKVFGNNLVANHPSDWSYDAETKTFTINSDTYISEYKSYTLTNRLLPTWGTTMDKDTVDFSQGPAKVTLTNTIGKSEEYTIKLVMPWQFSVPGKGGYNIVSLLVDGEKVSGEINLERLVGSETHEIVSGRQVELTIAPYGENEGKVIDTIEFLDEDGNTIEVEDKTINGNTVSFKMPFNNIRIGKISYKETELPVFVINAAASEYKEGVAMGRISTKVGNEESVIACAGDLVSVSASPIDHAVYSFVFSHWETEDIELTEEQKKSDSISFIMPEKRVNLTAAFEKKGVEVSFRASPGDAVDTLGTFALSQDIRLSRIISQNGIPAIDVYKPGSTVSFIPGVISSAYLFDGYSIIDQDGNAIAYEVGGWQSVVFTIPETGVTSIDVVAKYKAKEFSSIAAKANDDSMGTVMATVKGSAVTAAVLQDETVTVKATPSARYKFVSWDLAYADGSAIDFEISDRTSNPATFVVPDNGKSIMVTGNFELDPEQMSTECYMLSVELFDGNTKYIAAKEGTAYTIIVPQGTDSAAISNMVLKLTASDYATIKKSGDTANWPADGKVCDMAPDTPVTFTVTAEDGKTTQDYTVTLTGTKSSEKEITAVRLLDGAKNVIAQGALSGDTWTIDLSSDIDPDLAGRIGTSTDVFMQIEYTGASLMQAGGYDDAGQASWSTGTILCGVSVNSQKDFTVTAEDGSTKDYIIVISYTVSDAPTISNGSVERTGENTAIVKFTSNQIGAYYYQLVEKGASADIDTNKNGSTALAGENTLNISNLTADARDVYIIVKNATGVESIPYKLEIPAYETQDPEPGSYTITIMTPKGGNLSTNVTTANQGDSILVTVSPKSGYQMVEGSMTYTLAVAGGETVKITGNRFTMPDCDVTLTCRWEEAVVEEAGITSFVIMGVSGVISQSSDTEYNITLTLPHGTDVANLTPAITSNGNVTISPASGKAQDFSSPVTYTVTLEDGSKLVYKVSVYVSAGSKAERMWENITDTTTRTPWWEYANELQKQGKYPKYW